MQVLKHSLDSAVVRNRYRRGFPGKKVSEWIVNRIGKCSCGVLFSGRRVREKCHLPLHFPALVRVKCRDNYTDTNRWTFRAIKSRQKAHDSAREDKSSSRQMSLIYQEICARANSVTPHSTINLGSTYWTGANCNSLGYFWILYGMISSSSVKFWAIWRNLGSFHILSN